MVKTAPEPACSSWPGKGTQVAYIHEEVEIAGYGPARERHSCASATGANGRKALAQRPGNRVVPERFKTNGLPIDQTRSD